MPHEVARTRERAICSQAQPPYGRDSKRKKRRNCILGAGEPGRLRHADLMKARILVALLACVVGLSSCGDGTVGENGAAGDVERVKAALAALREARTATLTGTFVHSFLDSDIPKKVRTAFKGTYQADVGAWPDVVHAKVSDPDATGENAVTFAPGTWVPSPSGRTSSSSETRRIRRPSRGAPMARGRGRSVLSR
jgi:hypothetical protein